MIAGEFAVLEPRKKLAVMAVNRFVSTTIEKQEDLTVSLVNFNLMDLSWKFHDHEVYIDTQDKRVHFVESAMSVALLYLEESCIPWEPFKLTVKSELDDESGIKYGLGSSAAVTVSVVEAILTMFMPHDVTKDLVFRLSALSHAKTQGNGSGADVAASSFGGVLQYASFQAYWLNEQYKKADRLVDLVDRNWPYLSLRPLNVPEDIYICIGWTGKPASTPKLVDQVLQLKHDKRDRFDAFLEASERAVSKFMNGMEEENIDLILEGIKENRQALRQVGEDAHVMIETPQLTTLCDLAETYGGAGKPSGAGGGDSGIAFMPTEESVQKLKDAWKQAGIKPLDLIIHKK